jgi:hypothetical protein
MVCSGWCVDGCILVAPKIKSQELFLWHYNFAMEQTKKPRGRPVKPEGEKLERRAVYLPPDLWAKIDANGLEWLRGVIRRARPPAG